MSKFDIEAVAKAVRSALPTDRVQFNLHEPLFQGNEWKFVRDCLDTGWVSSAGRYVSRFENSIAEYTGVSHAIAFVNGTAALHLSLILVGVQSGDEVLVPGITFVATANAVAYCGAVPHFVGIEEKTLGVDCAGLSKYLEEVARVQDGRCINKETGRRIAAVIAVHTFGHPVDLDPLAELCRRYEITLIEDAAEALGSFYKGKHVGHWGRVAVLSFNGNKIVTTGGGGAILTNDEVIAKKARHLSTTARTTDRWEIAHDEIGYNYRLPNINAALGCAQLEQLQGYIMAKRKLAQKYRTVIESCVGISIFLEAEFAKTNYWLNVLLLDEEFIDRKDDLLEKLREVGVSARPAWTPLHRLPMYEKYPRMDLVASDRLAERIINIPSSPELGMTYA